MTQDELDEAEHYEIAERNLRIAEALLFASSEPLGLNDLATYLSDGADVPAVLAHDPWFVARNAGRMLGHTFRGSTLATWLGLGIGLPVFVLVIGAIVRWRGRAMARSVIKEADRIEARRQRRAARS